MAHRCGKCHEWTKYIYPDVHTEIKDDEMIKKLFPAYDPKQQMPSPAEMRRTQSLSYCEYLNSISRLFREMFKVQHTIQFYPKGDTTLVGHATKAQCHPDIVAIRRDPGQSVDTQQLYWSQLEATGKGDSRRSDPLGRAAAYTSHHLQARPDLVSIVGIYVSTTSFTIFFSNACRVLHTREMEWKDEMAGRLLWAYMWRLYNPDVDPSIQIDLTRSLPHFTITGKDGRVYDGFVIRCSGESIGRRTIVMENIQNSLVIKEQYIEDGRRYKEGPILEKIHKSGRFPGVVRPDSYEPMIYDLDTGSPIQCQYDEPGSEDTITKFKTRLVMKDRGTRLIDEATPRSFLMGIYDLLEISRMLFKKRNILHRDISPYNVLISTEPIPYTEELEEFRDMYFSAYLLKEFSGQGLTSHRLETRAILIDFDCSEDQGLGHSTGRTGTPIFMARMVRSDTYPRGIFEPPSMPSVDQRILRYPEDRLKAFPANDLELIRIPEDCTRPADEFRHLLRYDAESVFWCILWWCIRALPVSHVEGSPGERIDYGDWLNLIHENDSRNPHYISSSPYECLHPSYSKLEVLLNEMRYHLQGDLSFAKDKSRDHVEYLHEAFQRIILNFLVKNASEDFMDLEKSPSPRLVMECALPGMDSRLQSSTSTIPQSTASIASQLSEAEISQRAQKRTYSEVSEDGPDTNKRRHMDEQ